jgi:hypothetical protein
MAAGYSPIIVYKENKISYFNALEKAREGKSKNYFQSCLSKWIKATISYWM